MQVSRKASKAPFPKLQRGLSNFIFVFQQPVVPRTQGLLEGLLTQGPQHLVVPSMEQGARIHQLPTRNSTNLPLSHNKVTLNVELS